MYVKYFLVSSFMFCFVFARYFLSLIWVQQKIASHALLALNSVRNIFLNMKQRFVSICEFAPKLQNPFPSRCVLTHPSYCTIRLVRTNTNVLHGPASLLMWNVLTCELHSAAFALSVARTTSLSISSYYFLSFLFSWKMHPSFDEIYSFWIKNI